MALTIRIKLKEVLEKRGLTQTQLAEISGVRRPSISELATGARTTINKQHLIKIMEALNITDITEIIEVVETKG
ncbi:DNA-binding transcriptional regulator, XRE family [Desulfotomaculum arcticum]|uniref:DNA-binding transcriptional regulator, XRE family n=1 Tax=Desulfotruncus arcticus DSM 17038 TaxID=1121424 RepID=A0A1I2YBR9_9FIRM|nr:helix-turn-helix transcriptional regulator [Desulfotruncus arcticus]SFH22416.1 DNA-binding transcriptional regulator, XRE family [Desulfotomaculum arcticum] [Desulfotruncus arcticus DSM 17038]